ncbi:putative ATP-grasp-modified RiPP [Amycolatopsis sp. EV170708-02-1]|uniref:putative ATP-grasp-modified RiPP n=1 Tax=Amycolatopsis sp. EV170708-02-1 TaxID=2919322 RepID=UPI001F0B8E79|nr:putative ATP-grasp-modified RiPP [Amycolatopsis sp. EV170708-02-1]UMP04794.1 putative ATP-grasp-modified RiPP [Amycolatopsis sp. EV170708-02-1]
MSASNPFAPVSAQFALDGASFTPRHDDVPSPVGVRTSWSYDPVRQVAVDAGGRAVIESPMMTDPSAETTSTVDGEDGPSSEDWDND